jgi:hypothetical protein
MPEFTDEELIRTSKKALKALRQTPKKNKGQFYVYLKGEWFPITEKFAIRMATEKDQKWIKDIYPTFKKEKNKMDKIKNLITSNKKALIVTGVAVGVVSLIVVIGRFAPKAAILEMAE